MDDYDEFIKEVTDLYESNAGYYWKTGFLVGLMIGLIPSLLPLIEKLWQ